MVTILVDKECGYESLDKNPKKKEKAVNVMTSG